MKGSQIKEKMTDEGSGIYAHAPWHAPVYPPRDAKFTGVDPANMTEIIKGMDRRRHRISFRRKRLLRNLSLFIKIAPLLIVVSLLILLILNMMSMSIHEIGGYDKKFQNILDRFVRYEELQRADRAQ